jgi:hypothetical protein
MDRSSKIGRAWHAWAAFTAFLLVAGTFGSFSAALNICAVVELWRIYARSNGQAKWEFVVDPHW